MEHSQASSRKRTSPTDVSRSGSVYPCCSNEEYCPNYLPGGPKRQRFQPSPRDPTSDSNALSVSPTSSFVPPDGGFSNILTQQESDIVLIHDGFSTIFPPAPSLAFQPYPGVESHFPHHQDVVTANNAAGILATHTMTNGTFPPGSLYRQSVLDPHDCVNQSPDGGNERIYAGSDDLNFSLGDESQLNEFNDNHLISGSSGEDVFQACRSPAKSFQTVSACQR